MASEKFPKVSAGEPIRTSRANREGEVLERVARLCPGSGLDGQYGGATLQFSRTLDARLATLKVTDVTDAPVYLGVFRQYDFVADEWTDGTKLWKIDTGATDTTLNEDDIVVAYYDRKRGAFIPVGGGGGTVGFCLNEDHPGRGILFDVHLGTWDSAVHRWVYAGEAESESSGESSASESSGGTSEGNSSSSEGDLYKCIDWRYGVPYPLEGATGLGEWRASDTYGKILEVVALDCESPGECGD